MPVTALLGALWGDEGKGRVAYALASRHDIACRFNGGPNAAHTVHHAGQTRVLKQVPVGVFSTRLAVLGDGMALHVEALAEELAELREAGARVDGVRISERAHVIVPQHRLRNRDREDALADAYVGTTFQGVGDAFADKAVRTGIQVRDLLKPERLHMKLGFLDGGRSSAAELRGLEKALLAAAETLKPHVDDTAALLRERLAAGDRVLAEAAQGALLDVNHGVYPHVTSGSTTLGAVSTGLGIAPQSVDQVIGVLRAYSHRESKGPLPTELPAADEQRFRLQTDEYTLRVGWLDLFALRYSTSLNGYGALALTHLDALAGLKKIRVCTGYLRDGRPLTRYPTDPEDYASLSCEWKELDGFSWTSPPSSFAQLPAAARAFTELIQSVTGVPLRWLSVAGSGALIDV